jgi:hypothetical protein
MSLSRFWQRQDRRVEAHELLASIYGWFTEAEVGEAHLLQALNDRRMEILASTAPLPILNDDGHCTAAGPLGRPSPPRLLPSQ